MINLHELVASRVQPGYSVLDIGCGNKDKTCAVHNASKIITIDAWANVNPDICMDIATKPLPFEDNSIDIVLMIDLIEHLEKDKGWFALNEAKRVCRKELILLTPLWWDDNHSNTDNPSLWCYGNEHNNHLSLWNELDFPDFNPIEYAFGEFKYFLGIYTKP